MHASPDLHAEWMDGLDDVLGTTHGAGGTVERGQEPVTGRVDLSAPEAAERTSDESVVTFPARLARPGRP